MDYIVVTEDLAKNYGGSDVVSQVNLHVPKGRVYGLLGRNGAGKTTVMKMMLNLVKPTRGRILLFGKDNGTDPREIYHKIGSIIESPGFYDNLTAYDNLRLLQCLRGKKDTRSIIDVLETVNLSKETKKPFSDYSLGMKQRLGIAAAIIHEPELLILDEPINGLDPIGISIIRSLLIKLSRERGTTILISSHALNEIEQIADVIGVMQNGNLIEEVDMEKLRQRMRIYTRFAVSDTAKAAGIIKARFPDFACSVEDENYLLMNTKPAANSVINKTLVEGGVGVTEIAICEETLEAYFAELIGGGKIA